MAEKGISIEYLADGEAVAMAAVEISSVPDISIIDKNADESAVIDSYKKDIVPAESIGCRVLWLKGKGWTAEEDAVTHPCIIKNLSEVSKAVL